MKDVVNNLSYKGKNYSIVFNLNVMEKIQEQYGDVNTWGKLVDGTNGEPDVKALKYGFTAMINEAIDINNEETGSKEPFVKESFVGRMLWDIGLDKAVAALSNAVVESTPDDEDKEKNG